MDIDAVSKYHPAAEIMRLRQYEDEAARETLTQLEATPLVTLSIT